MIFKRKENEDKSQLTEKELKQLKSYNRNRSMACIGSIVLAITSAVTFFMTEDMTLKVALADRWTLLMAVLMGGSTLLAHLSRTEKKDEDEAKA